MRFLLPRNDKITVRDLARDSFLESSGDYEKSVRISRTLIRRYFRAKYNSIISTILISIAIRLAIALIKYWIENRILMPPRTYTINEPGYDTSI